MLDYIRASRHKQPQYISRWPSLLAFAAGRLPTPAASPNLMRPDTMVEKRINWAKRFATEFATEVLVWASLRLRLRFGLPHKSLFCSYKPFIHKHLQSDVSDFESEGCRFESCRARWNRGSWIAVGGWLSVIVRCDTLFCALTGRGFGKVIWRGLFS